MKLEGYISKKVIRNWLENYEALEANDIPLDQVPGNSGPRESDGITSTMLNKAMLDQAVENLPEELRTCVKNRWYYKHAVRHTCNMLRISIHEYYKLCDEALDTIYRDLNGEMVGIKQLLKRIYGK